MSAVDGRDLAKRAAHTLWQAFVAALGVAYAASGLDVSQVVDMDTAKKFGLALAVAVAGAALSAVKTTVAGLLATPDTGPGGVVEDTGPGHITPTPKG